MSTAVPFCESIGVTVPAHLDSETGRYVVDTPFPQQFDEGEKRWLAEEARSPGTRSWSAGARARPANEELVEMIQRGRVELAEAA